MWHCARDTRQNTRPERFEVRLSAENDGDVFLDLGAFMLRRSDIRDSLPNELIITRVNRGERL